MEIRRSLVPAESRFIERLPGQNFGPYKVTLGRVVKKMSLSPLILSSLSEQKVYTLRGKRGKWTIPNTTREISGTVLAPVSLITR